MDGCMDGKKDIKIDRMELLFKNGLFLLTSVISYIDILIACNQGI